MKSNSLERHFFRYQWPFGYWLPMFYMHLRKKNLNFLTNPRASINNLNNQGVKYLSQWEMQIKIKIELDLQL